MFLFDTRDTVFIAAFSPPPSIKDSYFLRLTLDMNFLNLVRVLACETCLVSLVRPY